MSKPIFSRLPVVRLKMDMLVWLLPFCRHVISAYGSAEPFIEIIANVVSTGSNCVGNFKRCFWFSTLDFHFHDVMSPASVHVYSSLGLFKSNWCPMMLWPSMPSSDRIHSPVTVLNTLMFSAQITNNALWNMAENKAISLIKTATLLHFSEENVHGIGLLTRHMERRSADT